MFTLEVRELKFSSHQFDGCGLDTRIGKHCAELVKHQSSNHRPSFAGWRRGVVVSGVRRMNEEVNARRARLVPGWVTVFGRVYHLGM